MTYGPVSEDLRHALAQVMSDTQPEVSLNGRDDNRPEDTEPEALVTTVEVYRGAVLRAAHALSKEGSGTERAGLPLHLGNLLRDVPLPSSDQLADKHPVALVDAWRRAALAATIITERELPAMARRSRPVRVVLGRDGAQIVVALLRLDARYAHVEGWRTITARLGSVDARALVVAAEVARGWPQQDPTSLAQGLVADQLGYDGNRRPVARPTALSEVVANVYAANEALAGTQPGVDMLRSIAKGHEAISSVLSKQAWSRGLLTHAEDLTQRAGAYRLMATVLANARSGASDEDFEAGGIARAHILLAASTLPHVTGGAWEELRSLAAALHQADQIIATTVADGMAGGWFFEAGEDIAWRTRGAIKVAERKWEIMRPAGHPVLLKQLDRIISLLKNEHYSLSPEPSAARERAWFAGEIERTTIQPPSNAPVLPANDPRAVIRSVLASQHDGTPPTVRLVHARELGPAYTALVEAGALRVVRDGVAVPVALPITPAVRAAALADKVRGSMALAGRTAVWVHTGLTSGGNLQLAGIPDRSRPRFMTGVDVWDTRHGTSAVTTLGGVRVTTPLQTAIEVAVHLPAPEAHRMLLALASSGVDLSDATKRMDLMNRVQGRPRARAILSKAADAVEARSTTHAATAAHPRPARGTAALRGGIAR